MFPLSSALSFLLLLGAGAMDGVDASSSSLAARGDMQKADGTVQFMGFAPKCCRSQKNLDFDENALRAMRDDLCNNPKGMDQINAGGHNGNLGYQMIREGKPRTEYLIYTSDTTDTYNNSICVGATDAIIEGCMKQGWEMGTWSALTDDERFNTNGQFLAMWVPKPAGKRIRRDERPYPPPKRSDIETNTTAYEKLPEIRGPVDKLEFANGMYMINGEPYMVEIEGDPFNRNHASEHGKRDSGDSFLPWVNVPSQNTRRDEIFSPWVNVPSSQHQRRAAADHSPLKTSIGSTSNWHGENHDINLDEAIRRLATQDQRKRGIAPQHEQFWTYCDAQNDKSEYMLTASGTWQTDPKQNGQNFFCHTCTNLQAESETQTESYSVGVSAGIQGSMASIGVTFQHGWEKSWTRSSEVSCGWTYGSCHAWLTWTKMSWQRGIAMEISGPHLPGHRKISLKIVHGDAPQKDQGKNYDCNQGCCGADKSNPNYDIDWCAKAEKRGMNETNKSYFGVCNDPLVDPMDAGTCQSLDVPPVVIDQSGSANGSISDTAAASASAVAAGGADAGESTTGKAPVPKSTPGSKNTVGGSKDTPAVAALKSVLAGLTGATATDVPDATATGAADPTDDPTDPDTTEPDATDPTGADTTDVDPTGLDTTGEDQTDITDPDTADDPTGADTTDTDTTDTDPTGLDTTGDDTTELDPTGLDTTGEDTTGEDTTGEDTTAVDPTETDSTGLDPTETDLTDVPVARPKKKINTTKKLATPSAAVPVPTVAKKQPAQEVSASNANAHAQAAPPPSYPGSNSGNHLNFDLSKGSGPDTGALGGVTPSRSDTSTSDNSVGVNV